MIFFDIDGTLLDYDHAERKGMLDFFEPYKHLFTFDEKEAIELWKQLSNKYFEQFLARQLSFQEQKRLRMKELFNEGGINLTNQEADEKFEKYLQLYKENWIAYSDVIEVLNDLRQKNYSLGIITNGDYQQQIEKLQRIGIENYFDSVITSSEVGVAKPDKSIFIEASNRTNKTIENCYYIGDRLDTDALGSKKAGMTSIWLNRIDTQHHPDVIVIRSLSELLNAIGKQKSGRA
jgi:putative hydrolase of the HAD superfamily